MTARRTFEMLSGGLGLSALVVREDPAQLAGQLAARLGRLDDPGVQRVVAASRRAPGLRLRPVTARLASPEDGQRGVLSAQGMAVRALALDPHGRWVAVGDADAVVTIVGSVAGEERARWSERPLTEEAGARKPRSAIRQMTPPGVTALDVSPDGTLLAVAAGGGLVRVADAVDGSTRAALQHPDLPHNRGQAEVAAVAFVGDGTRVVTAAAEPGALWVWDIERSEVVGGFAVPAKWVAAGPGGRFVYTGGAGVAIVDLDAGDVRQIHKPPQIHYPDDTLGVVTVSPDEQWFALGGTKGTVAVFDTATGEERARIDPHAKLIRAVVAASDGSALVCGVGDGRVEAFSPESGASLGVLGRHGAEVRAVRLSTSGAWGVSGAEDGSVHLWESEPASREVASLERHEAAVTDIGFAADAALSVPGKAGPPILWDPGSGARLAVLEGSMGGLPIVVADRAVAASGIWHVPSGERIAEFPVRLPAPLHPSGPPFAVSVEEGVVAVGNDERNAPVKLFSVYSGLHVGNLEGTLKVNSVFADGRRVLALPCQHGVPHVWDTKTGQLMATFEQPTEGLRHGKKEAVWKGAAILGKQVACIASEMVGFWDLRRGSLAKALERGHEVRLLFPRGRYLAAVGGVGPRKLSWGRTGARGLANPPVPRVMVWDCRSGGLRSEWRNRGAPITALAWETDTTLLVGDDAGWVRRWLIGSDAPVPIGVHRDRVTGLAPLGDGRWVSGARDGTIVVWDVGGPTQVARFTIDAPVAAVTASGDTIVVGDTLGLIHVLRLVLPRSPRVRP
jgi:WD40 repeat protein